MRPPVPWAEKIVHSFRDRRRRPFAKVLVMRKRPSVLRRKPPWVRLKVIPRKLRLFLGCIFPG